MLESRNAQSVWEKWWAWRPVRAHNRTVWLRWIYRKKQWHRALDPEIDYFWIYADNIFTILAQIK